ncbi:MAG: hypothetical protein JWL84_6484 [Rhodospirillales bacterium]|nr:hypothetical protein [Rhodospirillales bacterium]
MMRPEGPRLVNDDADSPMHIVRSFKAAPRGTFRLPVGTRHGGSNLPRDALEPWEDRHAPYNWAARVCHTFCVWGPSRSTPRTFPDKRARTASGGDGRSPRSIPKTRGIVSRCWRLREEPRSI